MGKTSKSETTQQIDPQLRKEVEAVMDGNRMIASLGYNPYQGSAVADFTPAQRSAFSMQDAMSRSLGFVGNAADGGPTGATEGAYGIMGFSPKKTQEEESPISDELAASLEDFYKVLSGEQDLPLEQEPPKGNKKKTTGSGLTRELLLGI